MKPETDMIQFMFWTDNFSAIRRIKKKVLYQECIEKFGLNSKDINNFVHDNKNVPQELLGIGSSTLGYKGSQGHGTRIFPLGNHFDIYL